MNTKQDIKFKVFCYTNTEHLTKGLIEESIEEDKPLILEGIASSSNIDLEGDYMTKECLTDMKKQALGLSIFLDHEHTLDKIVGKVTHVLESSTDVFKIKFSILPKFENYILEFLENGINLGLSIGAKVTDFDEKEDGWKINKVKLLEVSIVGIPANQDTVGSVKIAKDSEDIVTAKCFNGACKQVIDKLSSSDLVKELEDGKEEEDECLTRKEVVNMINEASNVLKDQIITEIVSEYKLDNQNSQKTETTQNSEFSEDEKTDSSTDEDKEKNYMEMDKLKELVALTIKELEEAETDVETPKPVEEEEVEAEVEVEKELEEVVEEPTEEISKDADVEEVVEKSSEETVEVEKSVEEDEIRQIIKNMVQEERELMKKSLEEERTIMKKELKEEVESELFKALSVEREPVATSTEEVKKDLEIKEENSENSNVMSAYKMAEYYCNQ